MKTTIKKVTIDGTTVTPTHIITYGREDNWRGTKLPTNATHPNKVFSFPTVQNHIHCSEDGYSGQKHRTVSRQPKNGNRTYNFGVVGDENHSLWIENATSKSVRLHFKSNEDVMEYYNALIKNGRIPTEEWYALDPAKSRRK